LHTGYAPVRDSFTHKVALNHLLGNHTVGIYPLRLDSTVLFCAIDLDLNRSLVSQEEPGSPRWNEVMAELHEFACRLSQRATELGVANYLEDSGGKGRHLWCFFERPLSARLARRFATHWAMSLESPSTST